MNDNESDEIKMLCGTCPDSHCNEILYFVSGTDVPVACNNCGQTHSPNSLLNVHQTTNMSKCLKSILLSSVATKKSSELVKVRGLSNFHCKIISPLLTYYGMEKKSGKAKLLSELGQEEVFNCAVFGNRAFLIEQEHLSTEGYGIDQTGSLSYLRDTLEMIEKVNNGQCLVPLHTDGDGHCLVHAISRAVIGRELLWHSLRQNLKDHLQKDNMKYRQLFHNFIDVDEWEDIISEADPNYHPQSNEPFGLRNMHVFGLANVLRRPIILMDNLKGMQSSGDYSGLFLPAFVDFDLCKSQGLLHKPLAIAWSSSGRNHYVPLVGVRGSTPPKIPRSYLPKAWGMPNELVSTYIDFDENDCCTIGGSLTLKDQYVQRLVKAMNDVFYKKHQVSPELVTNVNQYIIKPSNTDGYSIPEIIQYTKTAVDKENLFYCLSCHALKEVKTVWPRSWREPGGRWYTRAKNTSTGLVANAMYKFAEATNVPYIYEAKFDMLVAIGESPVCNVCNGVLREVSADGSIRYMNGDRTATRSQENTGACKCGFKHYWNGQEYDFYPKIIELSLEWNGKRIEEEVFWFESESNASLNSNVYEIASTVVQKHFPGEFGSETLVRKVVDKILQETDLQKNLEAEKQEKQETMKINDEETSISLSKVIITGPKHKTIHKEELTMNQEERLTRTRIKHHAALNQKRKSNKISLEKQSGNTKHGEQKTNSKIRLVEKERKDESIARVKTEKEKPKEIKIRLTSETGNATTISLTPESTFKDLQEMIEKELGIPEKKQKIRYGFPPKELKPPERDGVLLPLTHGDRVSVAEIRETNMMVLDESTNNLETRSTNYDEINGVTSLDSSEEMARKEFASSLLNLLQRKLEFDKWEQVNTKPELFTRGGQIYDQVVKKLGPLKDDMHLTIPGIPGKTFVYNEKEDKLEICLGSERVPVQPLDTKTMSRAKTLTHNAISSPLRRPHDESMGSFSGALRHRNPSQGRTAFSGNGRTLGGNLRTEDQLKNDERVNKIGENAAMDMDDVEETKLGSRNTKKTEENKEADMNSKMTEKSSPDTKAIDDAKEKNSDLMETRY